MMGVAADAMQGSPLQSHSMFLSESWERGVSRANLEPSTNEHSPGQGM